MRENLKPIEQQRLKFTGTFEHFGDKPNWFGFPVKTVLLLHIRDNNGVEVTDHLWFNHTKGFQRLGMLEKGDVIEFDARVTKYVKGYVDEREYDLKLSYPTKFRKIRPKTTQQLA